MADSNVVIIIICIIFIVIIGDSFVGYFYLKTQV